MTSTKHLLLVLCLGICVGMCRSSVEDVAEENTESLSDSASREAIGSDDIIRMPIDKMQDTYENAKQKLKVSDKASNVAHNEAKGGMDCGGNHNYAFGVYDEAKDKVSEAYMYAKNSMTEEAKIKYEAAKEKASEATGNLGAKMRNTP
ncbi:unnamed protein product [Lathyrus oleraceus]|uniref:uncharacterized protein LOC127120238 n=1 Tax=Pisum sativum TaxID=3888 RepID=UPI0021CE8EAE|nr:uncharacterized protein LOC127120238 [Pisum sativum]